MVVYHWSTKIMPVNRECNKTFLCIIHAHNLSFGESSNSGFINCFKMAAFIEETGELIAEVDEGIDAEAAGEAGEAGEAEEAFKAEVAEARENVSMLGKAVDAFKELSLPQVLKSFTVFVGKNAAIGAILFGVNVLLQKLTSKATGGEKPDLKKKQQKVKAVAQLVSDVSKLLQKLSNWAKDKENVTVNVGDDIDVPLPDLLSKFTKPMEKVRVRFFKNLMPAQPLDVF